MFFCFFLFINYLYISVLQTLSESKIQGEKNSNDSESTLNNVTPLIKQKLLNNKTDKKRLLWR